MDSRYFNCNMYHIYVCLSNTKLKHETHNKTRRINKLSNMEADVKLKFSYGNCSDFLTVLSGS